MRTRTLLLLAVGCGLAILVAGVVFLLGLANTDDGATLNAVGRRVEVGDVHVTVTSYDEADGRATVAVVIGGVDDPDGSEDFRLVVPGRSLSATSTDDACGAIAEADDECTLTFALGDASGGSRILLYRRGDEVARWELQA